MTDAKNFEISTFKDDDRKFMRLLLSNWHTSFKFFALYVFVSLQRTLSLVQIMLYIFYFLGANSATMSKTSFVSTKRIALRFEEKIWSLILPSYLQQAFSLTYPKEMADYVFENILDVIVANME